MNDDLWQQFHGPNAGYVLDLYERYRQNPDAVDPQTRAAFARWTPEPARALSPAPRAAGPAAELPLRQVMGAVNLAQAIREYGHLAAQLDPLGSPPPGDPALDPEYHGITPDDLRHLPASLVGGPLAEGASNAAEAISALRRVYSATTGYDYDHLRVPEEREWLREAAEAGRFRPPADPVDQRALLVRLTQVEVFETFLNRLFPGKTRFSIEGLDMLVPILDEIVGAAAEAGICTAVIGMAHRGRLNVLAHVLNKLYAAILAEFKDPVRFNPNRDDLGWTGDVKYHKGARRALKDGQEIELVIGLPPNPSHLEAINPVVEGMVRAAMSQVDQPGPPRLHLKASLPVLIHGDAAFSGEGIVPETLNLARLAGYHTGGTIHIISNNQLGYTTEPQAGRSTLYASDLAKGFKIPVVHVNADDPVACIEAARLAFAYRERFHKDFLVDLLGYRRHGHNEGDEPRLTQPLMYQRIDQHPTVRELWARTLVGQGVVAEGEPQAMVEQQLAQLQEAMDSLSLEETPAEPQLTPPRPGTARQVKTNLPLEQLQALGEALWQPPAGFQVNRKLLRVVEKRREALADADKPVVDWGAAEELALASILAEGIAVRFTGQDVERGTFSHRHAVWHDAGTGQRHTPLHALPQARAAFEIYNSPLTESATVGFEYGYNIQAPDRLVLWEAQYGDFVNNAQTILDEFLVSGRAKWEQTPSLVMLLPHAYEGQGPDHSSGYPERFLQMAADTNLRIANCTTPAQYFHLLRRQARLLGTDPLPLVVLTPKSLLRHPSVASTLRELAEGGWQPVIDDHEAGANAGQVCRLLLCSGKVYVDLVDAEQRGQHPDVAVVRLEQLYPFPQQDLRPVLAGYPNLREVIWVQEEPENRGAWEFVRPELERLIEGRWPLHFAGRPRSAAAAEGSLAWHRVNQQALIDLAYRFEEALVEDEVVWLEKA